MGTSAAAESEPTLAEAFGELAEGLVAEEEGSESPETQESASEPAPEAAPAAAPTAPAAPSAPQDTGRQQAAPAAGQPAAPAAPDANPLKDAQPLTYNLDGQSRSFDGAYVLPGVGAVIAQEALPRLQDRLQQADRLVGQNRQLYEVVQEFQRLGGAEGFQRLNAERALLDASGALLLRALTDEARLVELATDPVARQQLIKEITLTAREAQFTASNQFREQAAQHAASQRQTASTSTVIHNSVGNLAQQYAQHFPGLTADDVQAVRAQAQRVSSAIVRPATPAEAQQAGVRPGEPIVDLPVLFQALQDRHQLRTQLTADVRRAQTETQENAARLAASIPVPRATNGQPNAKRPARPATGNASSAKSLEQMSSVELTRAMRTGKIFDLIPNDEQ